MTRALNPRRVALTQLKVIQSNLVAMVKTWTWVPGTDIYADANGKWGSHGHRERKDIPAREYLENQPTEWARLETFMTTVASQATEMAAFARQQREALERNPVT